MLKLYTKCINQIRVDIIKTVFSKRISECWKPYWQIHFQNDERVKKLLSYHY